MRNVGAPGGAGGGFASASPVIYRYSSASLRNAWILGVLFSTAAVGLTAWFLRDFVAGRLEGPAFAGYLLMPAFLGLLALIAIAWIKTRLVLSADAIELRGLLSTRRMARGDIVGFRPGSQSATCFLIGKHGKSFDVPGDIPLDDRFAAWMGELPNLTALEQQAVLEQVRADTRLGIDPEQRMARLLQARRLAGALTWMSLGLVLWCLIYPWPYDLVVGLTIAWPWICIAIALGSRGLIRLDGKVGDPRPVLAVPMLMPALAIALRALFDVDLVNPGQAFVWGAIAGVPLGIVQWRATVLSSRMTARFFGGLGYIALATCYGAGALSLMNVRLDHRLPVVSPVTVSGKHISSGKHTTYQLDVSGWPGYPRGHRFTVSRVHYERARKGDALCAIEHAGALGMAWLDLGNCPAATP
ncbi:MULTISPECIES: hypothetical protein [Dyella]|uniref:PH domain-containing protein n=2 Tax=Dyella TaxID=231454 RepID=A0A4R0YR78_9GAMM|nr:MULTISPECIES: hypothetical protein [Dyella]TBR35827.1 hypothetical protein EYV96_17700 [Dyella terrae]TCI08625.1 hypothetical protein EZM97_28855 [Dyella soli]